MFFDPSTIEIPENDFTPLPEGKYRVKAENADLVMLDEERKQVKIEWRILEGAFAGRVVFDRLWNEHPNPIAQNIGLEGLAKVCKYSGKGALSSVYELDGAELEIVTKNVTSDDGTKTFVNVKFYNQLSPGSAAAQPTQQAQQAQPQRRPDPHNTPVTPIGEEPPF